MNAGITRLLMRICASRLDPNVSGVEFVDLLERLLDHATTETQDDEPLSDDEMVNALSADKDSVLPESAAGNGSAGRPRWRKPDRCKIDYDERVRIRMRAEEAKGDSQKYPDGFIPGLAANYNVSEQTIRNILKGD